MLHVTTEELAKLRLSLASLEIVLKTLDEVGAGIAAIHVDAAINQLRGNIDVVLDASALRQAAGGSCASEQPLTSR